MNAMPPFPPAPAVYTVGPRDPREGQPRRTLSLHCEVRQGLRPWVRVRLEDISERGFRLSWPDNRFDPNQPIRLRLPGLQLLNAQVRWFEGVQVGAEFTTPLYPAVLAHFVANAAP